MINYISTNLGVSAKILTPSKLVNDLIEKKFDELINKYKNVYSDVTIEKLESNYSKELSSKENVNSGYSLKKTSNKSCCNRNCYINFSSINEFYYIYI